MPFEFHNTDIPGVIRVVPRRFPDDRGWFSEVYKDSDFAAAGIAGPFLQDNHSVSAVGTVRGLHYQLPPHAQGKLVRVVRGRVWDVAVDIRRASSTCGTWVGAELSAENGEMLWVPPGFAHGFATLEDDTVFHYLCTNLYHPESEGASEARGLESRWRVRLRGDASLPRLSRSPHNTQNWGPSTGPSSVAGMHASGDTSSSSPQPWSTA